MGTTKKNKPAVKLQLKPGWKRLRYAGRKPEYQDDETFVFVCTKGCFNAFVHVKRALIKARYAKGIEGACRKHAIERKILYKPRVKKPKA